MVFDVPDQEIFKRLKDRMEKTGKYIPSKVIDDMASRYQTPTKEEGFDKIIRVSS